MSTFKKTLSLVLVIALLISMCTVFASADTPAGKANYVPSEKKSLERGFKSEAFQLHNTHKYNDDDIVSVIVEVSGKPSANYGNSKSVAAKNRDAEIALQHNLIYSALKAKNIEFELEYDYSAIFNGFSIKVKYGDLEAISDIKNVEAVHISNVYSLPDDEVNAQTSAVLSGAYDLSSFGYNGKGIKVAILDTGTYVTHEALQDYGLTDGVDEEFINSVIEEGIVEEGVYLSAKIPFAYDYADFDTNVVENESGHGTHCAGIALGYAENEKGEVIFSGAAPAAQLYAMKIFCDGASTTNSGIYMKALQDAYLLDADVVSMSIGAPAGFTYDTELENEVFGNVYQLLDDAGVIVCCSAGNEYSQGFSSTNFYTLQTGEDAVTIDYADYGLIGSPASYTGNVSVAAANNLSYYANAIGVGDEFFPFNDSSDMDLFYDTFVGETLEYVMVPGYGDVADYEGLEVAGKVAVVSRGELSFQDKLLNAYNAGAIAMICYNNTVGSIGMSIDIWYIPGISVLQITGTALAENADEFGYGTLYVSDKEEIVANPDFGTLCDFSSWGVTSDLQFGPILTGIGGYVYSSFIGADDSYILMSGTSMACPNVAGSFACLLQYLKEEYPEMDKYERSKEAEARAESTATLLLTSDGCITSPRKQGAGLIDVLAAAATDIYILDPVQTLYDDPERTGVIDLSFTVRNLTENDLSYIVDAYLLYDAITTLDGEYFYNALTSGFLYPDEDYTFETNFEDNIVTVPAGEDVEVNVTVTIDPSFVEVFGEYFTNGNFIDGYVCLYDTETFEEAAHASFFKFLGDWADGPVFTTWDTIDLLEYTYLLMMYYGFDYDTAQQYAMSSLETNVDYTYVYTMCSNPELTSLYGKPIALFGDGLFEYDSFSRDTLAISNPAGSAGSNYYSGEFYVEPALLRNAEHVIMLVVDSETGKVYYVDDTPYVNKQVFDYDYQRWQPSSVFAWDATNIHTGEYVPNNTNVNVEFYAILDWQDDGSYMGPDYYFDFDTFDYNYEAYREDLIDFIGEPVYGFNVTVDNEAPVIDDIAFDPDTGDFIITLSDNHFISYFGLYDEEFETLGGIGFAPDDETVVVLPAEAIPYGVFYLDVNDRATNFATYMCLFDGVNVHIFDPVTGFCIECDEEYHSVDEVYAYETIDEDLGAIGLDFFSNYYYMDSILKQPFVFDVSNAVEKAYEGGYSMYLSFNELLNNGSYGPIMTIDLYPETIEALYSQNVKYMGIVLQYNGVSFDVAIEFVDKDFNLLYIEEGSGSFIINIDYFGAEWTDENVRAFFVDEFGGYTTALCICMDGILGVSLDAFGYYTITELDAYGLIIEGYVSMAEEIGLASVFAAIMAQEAAYVADSAAQVAAEAALAAEEAKANAELVAENAAEAALAAEEAKANAEAAAEEAKIAREKAEEAKGNIAEAQANAEQAEAKAAAAKAAAEAAAKNAENAKAAVEAAKANAESAAQKAEEAKANAENAKAGAQNAQIAAENAKTAAESAKAAAENAKNEAQNANVDAQAAKAAVDSAKTAIDSAKSAVDSAKSEALKAKNDSENAKNAATDAKNAADTAKSEALKAQSAAEDAKLGADNAKAGAESAKNLAEAAKNEAENAKNDAVKAKNDAETAKAAVDSAKRSIDEALANADALKAQLENAIKEANAAKAAAEDAKAAAENAKTAAENAANKATEEKDSGCSSSIVGGAAIIVVLSLGGAVIFSKKKED